MRKQHVIPESVAYAKYRDDKTALSTLGKAGAEKKRLLKERKLEMMLAQARELAEEANEHICSVDN